MASFTTIVILTLELVHFTLPGTNMMRTKSKRQRSYKSNLDEAKEGNRIGQSDEGES